jgi:acyl-coenzyme A synthetase/AMP-(fatty) acid ligase
MLSGDWIAPALPARLRRCFPTARLLSLGGATEAGIWSVSFPVNDVPPDWRTIPYGWPLANQGCRILNADDEACPDWVVGELCITGASLATGYWQDPQLTARAFQIDPSDGQRMYRTGDLARYRGDGVIELLGREDGQVKVAGNRIECGEIERVIGTYPGVARVLVLTTGERGGTTHLHALVNADVSLDIDQLKRHCRQHLPATMQPHHWHTDVRFALNENGKVDRAAIRRTFLNAAGG